MTAKLVGDLRTPGEVDLLVITVKQVGTEETGLPE